MKLKHRASIQFPEVEKIQDFAVKAFGADMGRIIGDLFRNLYDDLVQFKQGYIHRTPVAGTDYTATQDDHFICYTTLTTNVTVTLPKCASAGEGKRLAIVDEAGLANTYNITLDGDGSETIDGSATFVISDTYGHAVIYTDGTGWYTL